MTLASLLALLAVAILASASPSILFNDGTIYVNNKAWLATGPTAFHVNNTWYSTSDGSLKLESTTPGFGNDSIGSYKSVTQSWTAGSSTVVTSVRSYTMINALLFIQSFPEGAAGLNTTQGNLAVTTVFPSFLTSPPTPLNYLAYSSTFAVPYIGRFGNLTGSPPIELSTVEGGFPLFLSDASLNTAVISPIDNFQTANQILQNDGAYLACGMQGLVPAVPASFEHATLFYLNQGFENTITQWGEIMMGLYGKQRNAPDGDLGLKYLSYWTDNGAYYYYNTEKGKTYQQTIGDVYNWLKNISVPIHSFQFDSWWYYKGPSQGVALWEAETSVFPGGMTAASAAIGGLPTTMHNRWFDPQNDYLSAPYNFADSFIVESRAALPVASDLWFYIMNKSVALGNLVVYEQDWLVDTYEWMVATQANLTAMSDYLSSMAAAAGQLGLTIQYCMPLPRHVMESVKHQIVTQIRATTDYQPGNDQWRISYASALIWSLGALPFKDNFWTGENQPGCPYVFSCSDPNTELESLVAALSSGPIALSDSIGNMNLTLVNRVTMANGVLPKPSRPAIPIDTIFGQFHTPPILWDVWHSYTDYAAVVSGVPTTVRWIYVMAANLCAPYIIVPSDLNAPLPKYLAVSWFNSFTPTVWTASNPFTLKAMGGESDPVVFEYDLFVPYIAGLPYVFLGEVSKYITVSTQRFTSIGFTPSGVTALYVGTAGESFTIATATTAGVTSFHCTTPASGNGTISCTAAGSCSC